MKDINGNFIFLTTITIFNSLNDATNDKSKF